MLLCGAEDARPLALTASGHRHSLPGGGRAGRPVHSETERRDP
jgi:hypothetical protein